jgi:hypothetical protein
MLIVANWPVLNIKCVKLLAERKLEFLIKSHPAGPIESFRTHTYFGDRRYDLGVDSCPENVVSWPAVKMFFVSP